MFPFYMYNKRQTEEAKIHFQVALANQWLRPGLPKAMVTRIFNILDVEETPIMVEFLDKALPEIVGFLNRADVKKFMHENNLQRDETSLLNFTDWSALPVETKATTCRRLYQQYLSVTAQMVGNQKQGSPLLPMACAFKSRCTILPQALLHAEANIEATDESGNTVLLVACAGASTELYVELIDFLIQSGANTSAVNNAGRTVLMTMVDDGSGLKHSDRIGLITSLVNAGAELNAVDLQGNTALMLCAMEAHNSVFDALLEAGADYSITRPGDRLNAKMIAGANNCTGMVAAIMCRANHRAREESSSSRPNSNRI
jgi:hypothetical protein